MTRSISRFRRPFDVARDATTEPQTKRAILASWASDRAAVEGRPALRKPSGAFEPMSVDDILMALRMLDGDQTTVRPCDDPRPV